MGYRVTNNGCFLESKNWRQKDPQKSSSCRWHSARAWWNYSREENYVKIILDSPTTLEFLKTSYFFLIKKRLCITSVKLPEKCATEAEECKSMHPLYVVWASTVYLTVSFDLACLFVQVWLTQCFSFYTCFSLTQNVRHNFLSHSGQSALINQASLPEYLKVHIATDQTCDFLCCCFSFIFPKPFLLENLCGTW